MNDQITEIRKTAKCVYLATEAEVADDIARVLNQAADALGQCQARVEELQSTLYYHVHEPVDDNDPALEIGHRLADLLQADDWNNVEAMLNGLSEHCRKQNQRIEQLEAALNSWMNAYFNMRDFAKESGLDATTRNVPQSAGGSVPIRDAACLDAGCDIDAKEPHKSC